MTYGNIRERPDLTTLFGQLAPEEAKHLTGMLVALDERLDQLAQEASEHVGVSYRNPGLGVFWRNIAGGAYGEAGEIWFEIHPITDEGLLAPSGPPWEVWSRISVFCDRQLRGETPGYSCTHDLFALTERASSPAEAVRVTAEHIEKLAAEHKKHAPVEFLGALHEELPEG